MPFYSERRCAKCDKQMTVREAASHNMIKGIAGDVCYPCKRDYENNQPISELLRGYNANTNNDK